MYTDHSQDPIVDVLAFIYCRSASSSCRPVIDATGEGATETTSPAFTTEASAQPNDGQHEIEDSRLTDAGSRATFPWLLYCLLEDSLNNGMQRIISWSDHGRAFEVHDRDSFEAHVMPR